ncbi:MAG: hypothetical protein ACJ8MR_03970 [Povalibacter sp.]
MSAARSADFQIVWVVVGDAVSSAGAEPGRAGRHLFMASDLAEMSMKQVSVSKLDVEPTVSSLTVGQRFCFTSLRIAATGANRSPVKRAPLSVSVRQDHRDVLGLESRSEDICVTPAAAGEYPVRFTSLIPAPDGTTRVAQVFIRVQEATASDVP